MAEFCLDCMQKINGRHYDEMDFILSDDLDLCEGCGQWKHVVVVRRRRSLWGDFGLLLKKVAITIWRKRTKK